MPGQDTILAVDIGSETLKVAEFSFTKDENMILENYVFIDYNYELNTDSHIVAIEDAFIRALNTKSFTARKVYISISGNAAFVRFTTLPPVGKDESKITKVIHYEARQCIPFPMEDISWDYQRIQQPGAYDQLEVMYAALKTNTLEKIVAIFERQKMQICQIEIAPCSCYNAARACSVGESEPAMILNIGGRCSSLIFIDNGDFYVRPIPFAGQTITQSIVKEFGIPVADAEEMKRRHGFVALGGAYEEPDSEVSATVSKIVRNVMTRLHGELNRSINVYRSQWNGRKPTRLYLAGGSSVMAFTPRFFSEKLRIPVEYLNPFQVLSISDTIDKEELAEYAHMFSELIGLGLRHNAVCPVEISLIPEDLRRLQQFRKKIPFFYSSAAALLLCLGITYAGLSQQNEVYRKQIAEKQQEVEDMKRLSDRIRAAQSNLNRLQQAYNERKSILGERNSWVLVLNELQGLMPARMWIVKLKTAKTVNKKKTQPTQPRGIWPGPDIFNTKTQTPTGENAKSEWIEIEGHSLYEKNIMSYLTIFKERVKKSPMFTDEDEEIITDSFVPTFGNNNVTTFKMFIRLKKAM